MRARTLAGILMLLASCSTFTAGPDPANDGGLADGGERESGSDGGGSDGGSDGGVASQACALGLAFCDDFELGDLSRWSTTAKSSAFQTVDVVDSGGGGPHTGKRQLRITTPDVALAARADAVALRNFAPISPAMLAVRFWVYLAETTSRERSVATWTYQSPTAPGAYFYGAVKPFGGNWAVQLNNPLRSYTLHQSAVAVGASRWICVELDMKLSDKGHVNLFIDGNLTINDDDATAGPLLDAGTGQYVLSVGLNAPDGAEAQTLYYDDVVAYVSKEITVSMEPRIGCQ
jgi:hypothetical protein